MLEISFGYVADQPPKQCKSATSYHPAENIDAHEALARTVDGGAHFGRRKDVCVAQLSPGEKRKV
jgi:hypothetical protein